MIGRADLAPGHQAAQAAHSVAQFFAEHADVASRWYNDGRTIVLVAAQSEDHLCELIDRLARRAPAFSVVREPDFDNAVTACAVIGDVGNVVASLPLSLRPAPPTANRAEPCSV